MRETLEREIKLAPGEGFGFPELMGKHLAGRVVIPPYLDTEDLRLAPYGVTLRHRVEDGTGLWQLKLPRGAARLELEVPGQASRPPVELVELRIDLDRQAPSARITHSARNLLGGVPLALHRAAYDAGSGMSGAEILACQLRLKPPQVGEAVIVVGAERRLTMAYQVDRSHCSPVSSRASRGISRT